MAETFFSKYPLVEYGNKQVKNISRRVVLDDTLSRIPTLFYPYELKDNIRSDQLAYYYYGDPHMDWMVFMTNGIIDPYYGWYLYDNEFSEFLKGKYGSEENAIRKVLHYRLNWASITNLSSEIDVSYYNNNLPNVLKKYYIPQYGYKSKVISYKRREEDWTVSTNLIYKLYITYTDEFEKELPCKIVYNNELISTCEIVSVEDDFVIVKHCEGDFFDNNEFLDGCYLTNYDQTFSGQITQSTLISRAIPAEEFVYWERVTAYDYENEKNESHKHLRMLDNKYSLKLAEALRVKLK